MYMFIQALLYIFKLAFIVVFENKEQFLQDILNLEIEARQSKSINFNKKQNLES